MTVKKALAAVLTSPIIAPLAKRIARPQLVIFMLHRFRDDALGTPGHDPTFLRTVLEYLRKQRVPIHSLRAAVRSIRDGHAIDGVVFTVDDGYEDFDTVGAPIFHEFDCPVTLFVATGFVDGRYWFWWDQITYAIVRTDAESVVLASREASSLIPLRSVEEKSRAVAIIHASVKNLAEADRAAHIDRILGQLDVPIPDDPPSTYRPMGWDRMRYWSERGADFAPHTSTHPSLGSVSLDVARNEVSTAYRRLREEVSAPLAVHCYPYGLAEDLSAEAARAAQEEGMVAAVTAMPGSIRPSGEKDLFLLPRYSFPDQLVDLKQVVWGIEHLKQMVRKETAITV